MNTRRRQEDSGFVHTTEHLTENPSNFLEKWEKGEKKEDAATKLRDLITSTKCIASYLFDPKRMAGYKTLKKKQN